ncbi:unnamed protein product, partial [Bubo scandiacus]
MMSSMYCKCSGASPCSRVVWISPWQMVGLSFHPWGSRFQVCVPPYNDIINELQVFWSPTFLQCSMDQSMANGGAVVPPLGQSIPGVLDTPP